MTAFPKSARVEDRAYLEWCRRQLCAFCGGSGGEAHHTVPKGMGGAVLRDDLAVPSCRWCHQRCHGETVDRTRSGGKRLGPIPKFKQIYEAAEARKRYLRERDERKAVPS